MAKGIVTINTDAGFYPNEKVGSYAYWIKSDDLFLRGSGLFKEPCKNSLEAEMKSIINALTVLIKAKPTNLTRVIINRDNIHTKSSRKGNELEKMIWNKIRTLKEMSNIKGPGNFHEFRHVKAHSKNDDARSWVNRWCDQQCTLKLREYKAKMLASLQENNSATSV